MAQSPPWILPVDHIIAYHRVIAEGGGVIVKKNQWGKKNGWNFASSASCRNFA
jgi:hypothetical protein